MSEERNRGVYILIGDESEDTTIARELLDNARIEYRFAYCRAMRGPLPQLVSGLSNFVGLGQISRVAKRAQNHAKSVEV
jgi:hypothetical protein